MTVFYGGVRVVSAATRRLISAAMPAGGKRKKMCHPGVKKPDYNQRLTRCTYSLGPSSLYQDLDDGA